MPVTFSYFEIEQFPELTVGQSVKTSAQIALPWGDDEAHTIFTYKGDADFPEFRRYHVEHQADRDVNAIVQRQHIRRMIEITEFDAFYHPERNYLLVQTSKTVARAALQRLAQGALKARQVEIPLSFVQQVGETTGGWFGSLKIAHVKAAALFGNEVTASEDWSHYEELGELTAVYLRVVSDDELSDRGLILTRQRGLVLYQNRGETDNLEFAAQMQQSINTLLSDGSPAT